MACHLRRMTNLSSQSPVPSPPFVETSPGVELCMLRQHAHGGMTFMVRMQQGAWAPFHDHPGGEETYMVSGRLRIAHRRDVEGASQPDAVVGTGQHFFALPGEKHDGVAEEECLFFVVAPGGVAVVSPSTDG